MNESYFILRKTCPACKSANIKELYSAKFNEPPLSIYMDDFYKHQGGVELQYLENDSFMLDECNECGLIYQRAIPNDFLMKKLYEEWIDPKKVLDLKVKERGVKYYSRLAREIEMIIRHFGVATSELVFFDFGSGWGDWCRMANAYGCSAYGTELSQTRIDYAKMSGVFMIELEETPEYQFDFINTEQVFEHIDNPLATLQYLIESLKPNGIIKISVPNGWDVKRRLSIMDWKAPKGSKDSLNLVAPLEHINCFSHDALVKMARIAGLVPVQIPALPKNDIGLILDYALRDILRPYYHLIKIVKSRQSFASTYLFFQKESRQVVA